MILTEDEPYLHRSCPTCQSTELDPSWRITSEPPAETCAFADLQSSWRGFFKDKKHFFTYHRCKTCRQVYAPIYFTPDQLTELYSHMEDNTGGLPEALLAKTQAHYYDLLLRHAVLSMGGYLEFGPDIGLFTRETLEHGAFTRYWMVEPNRQVYPTLERMLGRKSYVLLNDSSQIDEVPDGSLTLAVAIHVLDHFLEPQELLNRLYPKMRTGGWILVVTHNGNSLVSRAFGRLWPAYCLQHPQIYSPGTLKKSLVQAGFRTVRVRRTVNYFPVTYLLRHFFFASGFGNVPLPKMNWWHIGLKLGNIAAIGQRV